MGVERVCVLAMAVMLGIVSSMLDLSGCLLLCVFVVEQGQDALS